MRITIVRSFLQPLLCAAVVLVLLSACGSSDAPESGLMGGPASDDQSTMQPSPEGEASPQGTTVDAPPGSTSPEGGPVVTSPGPPGAGPVSPDDPLGNGGSTPAPAIPLPSGTAIVERNNATGAAVAVYLGHRAVSVIVAAVVGIAEAESTAESGFSFTFPDALVANACTGGSVATSDSADGSGRTRITYEHCDSVGGLIDGTLLVNPINAPPAGLLSVSLDVSVTVESKFVRLQGSELNISPVDEPVNLVNVAASSEKLLVTIANQEFEFSPFIIQVNESDSGKFVTQHIFALVSAANEGVLVTETDKPLVSTALGRPDSGSFLLEGAGPLSAEWTINDPSDAKLGVSIVLVDGPEQDSQQLSWEDFLSRL